MVNELTFVEGKMSSQVDRYRFFGTASLLSLLSAVIILPSFAVYGLHILDSSTAGTLPLHVARSGTFCSVGFKTPDY